MPKYIAAEPGGISNLPDFLSRELRRIEHGIPDGKFSYRAYRVVDLPTGQRGDMVYCLNGGAAGAPCIAVHDGTNWRAVALGAVIA